MHVAVDKARNSSSPFQPNDFGIFPFQRQNILIASYRNKSPARDGRGLGGSSLSARVPLTPPNVCVKK
jgi:hypothetical protein